MEMTSLPYFSLIWTGIGFLFILIGFFVLAYQDNKEEDYTSMENNQAQELFAYFLEEEEKKNDALRQTVQAASTRKEVAEAMVEEKVKEIRQHVPSVSNKLAVKKETVVQVREPKEETKLYEEIIALYEAGITVEEIAKRLNKGKGEIQLMLSLYSMR